MAPTFGRTSKRSLKPTSNSNTREHSDVGGEVRVENFPSARPARHLATRLPINGL